MFIHFEKAVKENIHGFGNGGALASHTVDDYDFFFLNEL